MFKFTWKDKKTYTEEKEYGIEFNPPSMGSATDSMLSLLDSISSKKKITSRNKNNKKKRR